MHKRKPFTAAVALAVAAAIGPLHPAAADQATEPAEFAHITTVAGEQPGFLPVRLPRPATVSLDLKDGRAGGFEFVEVEGDGRLQGFWLVDDPVERSAQLLVLRKAPARGTFGDERTMAFSRIETDDGVVACGSNCDVNLPTGDYRLYLITDGGPTAITVQLDGLTGEADLAPTEPVNAPQTWLEAPGMVGSGEVWRDRDTAVLESAGAIFTMHWRIQTAAEPAPGVFLPRAGVFGACRWVGEPLPVDATAPGCPRGEGHAFSIGGGAGGADASRSRLRVLSLSYDFEAGPITLGAWGADATTNSHTGLTAVFLPYDSDPAAARDLEHQRQAAVGADGVGEPADSPLHGAAADAELTGDGVVLEATGHEQEEILVLR